MVLRDITRRHSTHHVRSSRVASGERGGVLTNGLVCLRLVTVQVFDHELRLRVLLMSLLSELVLHVT